MATVEQPAQCKCDLRTRLVGDGCEVCNPELAKELVEQPAQGEPRDSREAFEALCAKYSIPTVRHKIDGRYLDPNAYYAWIAWQAAGAAPPAPLPNKTTEPVTLRLAAFLRELAQNDYMGASGGYYEEGVRLNEWADWLVAQTATPSPDVEEIMRLFDVAIALERAPGLRHVEAQDNARNALDAAVGRLEQKLREQEAWTSVAHSEGYKDGLDVHRERAEKAEAKLNAPSPTKDEIMPAEDGYDRYAHDAIEQGELAHLAKLSAEQPAQGELCRYCAVRGGHAVDCERPAQEREEVRELVAYLDAHADSHTYPFSTAIRLLRKAYL